MREYESLEVQKEELERLHKQFVDTLIEIVEEEEKKENIEKEELGGFDLVEDINLQMDFFEIMRNENNG